MKARRYVVGLRLNEWRKLHLATDSHSIGFLPVYESLEALHKDYPTSDYVLIEKQPRRKKGR